MDANSKILSASRESHRTLHRAIGIELDAEQFCALLVSRRRLERIERLETRLRGLRDLDSGEQFYTDERGLLEAR
jgi:hypothetical protein